MSLALALLLTVQSVAVERAELRLGGPFEHARWEDPVQGSLTLAARLRAGEQRRLVAPFPRRPGDFEPTPSFAGQGAVELLGWLPAELPGPPLLLARTRPPVQGSGLRPSLAAVGAAGCAALVVLALRHRPGAALAAGLGLAAGVFALQRLAPADGPQEVRVLEGLAPGEHWQQVDSALGELAFDARAGGPLGLEVWPEPEGGVAWRVVAGSTERWVARAAGSRLSRIVPLAPGTRGFEPDLNRWGALAEAWTRTADGSWRAHGPWPLGRPLPEPLAQAAAPPGWLASRLPQGRPVLIGRLAQGAFQGPPLREASEPAQPAWVRLVGFPTPE